MGTIDTIKDFYGDVADDWKKAWDDLLDRDDDDDLPFGLPAHALAAMPGDTLRTLTAMSLLQDEDNKKKNKNKNRNLAALALLSGGAGGTGGLGGLGGLTGPGGIGGAAAAVQQPVAALTGAVGSPAAVGELTQQLGALPHQLAALPQQIQQLSDVVGLLMDALKAVEPLLGAAGAIGAVTKSVPRKA
ncbi:hypothetical protein [Streptomyces sp. NPDC058683]|uniref:hypothetical protein n=1 Tax=Streptomyces sp. NPDC058683 TaxID=3346597 RepID=UPI003653BD6C